MANIYDKSSLVLIPSGTKTSKVYSQKPVPEYGAELVTNGGFSSGTGWSLSSGWSIASGKATASSTNNNLQTSTSIVTGGSKYLVSFEISNYSSGTLYVDLGTSSSRELYTSSGFKSIVLTAGGFNKLRFYGGSISCDIDNVSVKEVLVEDGDFTFSRSTAATRVNADGNIEKETQNLLLQSNTFDTTWINVGSTLTSGQSGYDGSNAWKVEASSAVQRLEQNIASQGVATYSMYAKAGNVSLLRVQTQTAGTDVFFDLSNGTIPIQEAAAFDATITDVGSGWYRCTMSVNETISNLRFLVQRSAFSVTIGDFLYVQDAQLEQGLVARDYIETTTAAVEGGITDNVPRLDYTDSSCPALLLEPLRTNIVPNSEYLGDWSLTNGTLTSNATISPQGVQNAGRVVFNNTALDLKRTIAVTASTTYTFSFYIKKESGAGLQGRFYDNSNGANIEYYDYTSQISGTNWSRVTRQITTPAGCTQMQIWLLAASSSIVTASFWGAQLESGSYATSYIPTYGTSVTRNEDVNNAYNVSSLIGQTEGTLYLEFVVGQTSDFQVIFQTRTTNTTTSNVGQIDIRFQNGSIRALGNDGGVNQFNINGGAISLGDVVKCAVAYQNNNSTFYVNGNQAATDTNCSFTSSVLDDITFNERAAIGTSYIQKQFIKQALLFKTRLSNEELAALTTI